LLLLWARLSPLSSNACQLLKNGWESFALLSARFQWLDGQAPLAMGMDVEMAREIRNAEWK